MKNVKTKNTLIIMSAAVVVLLAAALTLAWSRIAIGQNEPASASITTDENLVLTYTDCASSKVADCADISAELSPGDSVTKTIEIKNDSSYELDYTLYFQELYNTFKNDDLVYKIENITTGEVLVEDTPVPMSGSLTINQVAMEHKVSKDETQELKVTITFLNRDYSQNDNLNAEFDIKLSIEKSTKTLTEIITAFVNPDTPDFTTLATTDEGVYAMTDNYGTSYYFRGSVENNYVKFAGFYWRIIRVNGDGSIRMIYDGTSAHANGESSTDRSALTGIPWNETNYNDAKYVGYMYGGANGVASTAKTEADCEGQTDCVAAQTNETPSNMMSTLESWYQTNLKDNYGQYIADAIFCNDRSTASTSGTWWTSDTALGYGTNPTMYGAFSRLRDPSGTVFNKSASPTFECPQDNDKFTVESTTSGGNAALDEPIGLITIDEVAAAGGRWHMDDGSSNNSNYYLYKGHRYWTLSPNNFNSGNASVFDVSTHGQMHAMKVSNTTDAVTPVINLTPEYAETLKGSGTMDDPYTSEAN